MTKNERIIENLQEQTKLLFKVVDKLEQRISTLEKVLDSHAKCIGELRNKEHIAECIGEMREKNDRL